VLVGRGFTATHGAPLRYRRASDRGHYDRFVLYTSRGSSVGFSRQLRNAKEERGGADAELVTGATVPLPLPTSHRRVICRFP